MQDLIARWTIQLALVEELETHSEAWTADALEAQLRSRFRRCEEIRALLLMLPNFDEDEDTLDCDRMSDREQQERQQVKTLNDECYTLGRQCDLLAYF
jgi:hypothetical protein